ncbi:MAG: formate dehydrogenase accessory sulfurtransferase FdhD [Candidatus Krumholzibacteria bacterium]|nr:formate dehydrogenase accessory sulfurtransferase FdhD [Candidatus Krumholzibacteria bacterium]
MEVSSRHPIIRFSSGERSETTDEIVNELSLRLSIGSRVLATVVCSPDHLEDMAAGYLLTSGIVTDGNPIRSLELDPAGDTMNVELEDNSVIVDMVFTGMRPVGCGGGTLLFSDREVPPSRKGGVEISSSWIAECMKEFNRSSDLFARTGGVHSAAVADGSRLLATREDIGRHNALDKAIGCIYRSGLPLNDKVVLTSGRVSSEIMLKLVYSGVPVIVSRSAPTAGALAVAEKQGVTVVGFARGASFNVYTHPERVIF